MVRLHGRPGLLLASCCLAAFGEAVVLRPQQKTVKATKDAAKTKSKRHTGCGRIVGLSWLQRNPGAGMDPESIEPFNRVLKDGYSMVGCFKDAVFTYGDKFGDNKFSYSMGESANISVVHYTAHVPKEDRKEMTHDVCFECCRTIPEMNFFGILNGRECYCAPYYQAEASDSSDCSEVCDGSSQLMCGGKTKSNIFSMHMCDNTAEMLENTANSLVELKEDLQDAALSVSFASKVLQEGGARLQEVFGKVGDPGAADLMQQAKVRAGDFDATLGEADEFVEGIGEMKGAADKARAGDLSKSDNMVAAESLLKDMDDVSKKAAESASTLRDYVAPMVGIGVPQDYENASEQYYSAMYFVDKEHDKVPSTCTGELVEKPIAATLDGCARSCDHDVHDCVGFSHFEGGPEGDQWYTLYADGHFGDEKHDEEMFNSIYREHAESGDFIIKRECKNCWDSHKTIYMRRYDDPKEYNAYQDLLQKWRGDQGMGEKFDLYSSLDDAIKKQNAWKFCNGNDPGVGFPRDCGPRDHDPWQWVGTHRVAHRSHAHQDYVFSVRSVRETGLCFLFSKLKTLTYYTGCSEDGSHAKVKCMVKFSKFSGTTLKPDASGKCKQCLKEATHADRCYE
eukprot:TRINITY_DN15533_c0_g1_i1.p1 TRINITY_DN15533_c0_g1~~TRINITY_DN15533_c0_g1_i1.p1  ORF type:complete len:622 (-),score=157.86 TRINITY_DN15533_c0_g1_i1:109-1974(-)